VAGSVALQAIADSSTATPFRNDKNVQIRSQICCAGCHNRLCKSCSFVVSRIFVIPTEGRNLLVAGSMALQAAADSSTATPFRK